MTATAQAKALRGPRPARTWAKRADPRVRAFIASTVPATIRALASSITKIGLAAGVDRSRVSHWIADGDGNPVYDHSLLLWKLANDPGGNPHILLAHYQATIDHARMSDDDIHDAVVRFLAITHELEPNAECDENKAVNRRDADAMELCDLKKAALHNERAGLRRFLRMKNVDPFTYLEAGR